MSISKVLWMADGVVERTHPAKWNEALTLTEELVATIGKSGLTHVTPDSIEGFRDLASHLDGQDFSTVLDISGWMGKGLQPLFPQAELFDGFSLSRVRNISTPDLQTAGYTTTMSPEEIERKRRSMDLSKVLILDDTGFSGDTSKLVMDLWGIDYSDATHAFLVDNTGEIPSSDGKTSKPGVVRYLEELGGRVVYGKELVSPHEDGWHVRDTFDHPNVEAGLNAAITLYDNSAPKDEHEVSRLNRELYPQQLTSDDIQDLAREGRYIGNPKYISSEGSVYVRNPLLWTARNFREVVDEDAIYGRKSEVTFLLRRLSTISNEQKGLPAVTQALRAEIQGDGGKRGHFRGERMI